MLCDAAELTITFDMAEGLDRVGFFVGGQEYPTPFELNAAFIDEDSPLGQVFTAEDYCGVVRHNAPERAIAQHLLGLGYTVDGNDIVQVSDEGTRYAHVVGADEVFIRLLVEAENPDAYIGQLRLARARWGR